jgi:hypothetical protein
MTRGAVLAVRESEEEELTSGPRVAVRESEEGGGSGPARGWWADGKGKKRKREGEALLGWAERRGRERVWEVLASFLFFQNIFKTPF